MLPAVLNLERVVPSFDELAVANHGAQNFQAQMYALCRRLWTSTKWPELRRELHLSSTTETKTTFGFKDNDKAAQLKVAGNAEFKAKRFQAAAITYTKGLHWADKTDPELLATLYHNRSAAHSKLSQPTPALNDISVAVFYKPDYWKAWAKQGYFRFLCFK